MFSRVYQPFFYLLQRRLEEAEREASSMPASVREEYLAEITALLNEALSLGNGLSRKKPVVRNSPALPSQVDGNYAILARDLEWIAGQMRAAYEESIRLFNQYAGVQNTLRRNIRNRLHASSPSVWRLDLFRQPEDGTCFVDGVSGFACLPVSSIQDARPETVRLGLGCEGVPDGFPDLSPVLDGRPETAFRWNGRRLELVFEFPGSPAINAIALDVTSGDGLVIDEIASTPDGASEESWLPDYPGGAAALDGSTARFSGEWIYLGRARYVSRLRLALASRTGTDPIRLSGVRFLQKAFRAHGTLQTGKISGYSGTARLEADVFSLPPMTSVTHWISRDGVTYFPVQPGEPVFVRPDGFWYRAEMARSDGEFQVTAADLVFPGYDRDGVPVFPERMESTDLGGGLSERLLFYPSLQGELEFKELVLPESVSVRHGGTPLPAGQWSFDSSVLRISGVLSSGVEIRYRTNAFGRGMHPRLAVFSSPVLYGVRLVF